MRTLLLVSTIGVLAGCTPAPPQSEAPDVDGGTHARQDSGPDDAVDFGGPPPDLAPKIPSPFPAGTTLGTLMPMVIAENPSNVLTVPKVVAITYDNDVNRATVDAFFPNYAASSAWAAQTSEYGVGPLTVGTPRHITGNAPTAPTDNSIRQLLASKLNGSWGYPSTNTIYEFFYPVGTNVTSASGTACTDWEGYHSYATIGGVNVPYAVIVICPDNVMGYSVTAVQDMTATASHETIEAVTDPFFDAYYAADDLHAAFTNNNAGELGDMCTFADTTYWQPSDMAYTIQRTWSNKAAAAGHDPCVGAPQAVYYQAIPYLPDMVPVQVYGTSMASQGIKIAVGASATVTLTVFGDSPTAGPVTVKVEDYNSAWNGQGKLLDITASDAPLHVGDSLQATIKVLAKDWTLGGEQFMVTTTPMNGGPSTYYFAFVGQP